MSESYDPTLRRVIGNFDKPEFSDVLRLSGSPVFNVTARALCGMVVRGGMKGGARTLWYVDMYDIWRLLAAVHDGRAETQYRKTVTRLAKAADGGEYRGTQARQAVAKRHKCDMRGKKHN